MRIPAFPFAIANWAEVEATTHPGETGVAHWRTLNFGDIRVRMVEYSPGYLADHWCEKGHVLLCLEGELHTQLREGRTEVLRPGMSYQVGDGMEPHRSYSPAGAKLFIVD
jgi:quercetin dioxygenase-like cupin family protein